jgi:hypothetical protein
MNYIYNNKQGGNTCQKSQLSAQEQSGQQQRKEL